MRQMNDIRNFMDTVVSLLEVQTAKGVLCDFVLWEIECALMGRVYQGKYM